MPDLSPTSISPEEQQKIRIRGYILFTFGVIILLFLAWLLVKELIIIYVAALFAVVLMPFVKRICTLNIRGYQPGRAIAIIGLIIAAVGILTLFMTMGLPPVMRDLRQFSDDLPQRIPDIVARIKKFPFADRLGVDTLVLRAENALTVTASYLFTSVPLWLTHLFDILTTVFLCIYFMLEGEYAYNFFLSLFRAENRRRLDQTLKRAELKVSKWLLGQGLLMLILGLSRTIVFGLLHVRYFLLLGFLMGLLNIIPIAGGVITITLVAGVAALDSWPRMFAVLIFYIIYVNIENAVLTPRIMRSSVNLMGLTVLVSLLLGTALAGIVGALVAVPTAALLSVLLDEYAVQKA